jgi:hypothetical protein
MENLMFRLRQLSLMLLLMCPGAAIAANIEQFEGKYQGEAEFIFEGETERRNMSTTIEVTKTGFVLDWTTVRHKKNGSPQSKTYTVAFIASARENIFKSAMKNNVFGKAVPLDPLEGEPFVWARLEGDTLSVFSLFINPVGDYEMQEFHRTLVDEGLKLDFRRVHNGASEREIHTLLIRMD